MNIGILPKSKLGRSVDECDVAGAIDDDQRVRGEAQQPVQGAVCSIVPSLMALPALPLHSCRRTRGDSAMADDPTRTPVIFRAVMVARKELPPARAHPSE